MLEHSSHMRMKSQDASLLDACSVDVCSSNHFRHRLRPPIQGNGGSDLPWQSNVLSMFGRVVVLVSLDSGDGFEVSLSAQNVSLCFVQAICVVLSTMIGRFRCVEPWLAWLHRNPFGLWKPCSYILLVVEPAAECGAQDIYGMFCSTHGGAARPILK